MLRMMAAIESVRPDFVFLTGWEAAPLPMLVIGCQGGTNATSGVVPEVMRKIFDLAKAGRIAEARPLQLQVIELFDAIVYGASFLTPFASASSCADSISVKAGSRKAKSNSSNEQLCAKESAKHCNR